MGKNQDPNNRTVLLTGATGVIGQQFLPRLLEAGWNVWFTSRSRDSIFKMEESHFQGCDGPFIKGIVVDLEDPDLMQVLERQFEATGNYPTAFVHCARDPQYLKATTDGTIPTANWEGEFKIGITVPYQLTMFLSAHPKVDLKAVVHIASMYGVTAPNLELYEDPAHSPINYGVVKAAMIHLTKELAVRLAANETRVNAISYGGVEGRTPDAFNQKYAKLTPAGRMLNNQDLAGPLLFLLDERLSSGMTGHNMMVDGGWTIW